MLHVAKQWVFRALSLCVVGPVAAWMSHRVLAGDGTHETTMLTGASLGAGLVSLLGVSVLVALMGVLSGRFADRREGLLNMAFVLGWVAWTSGRLGEVLRVGPESSTLALLAVEGVVLMVAALLGCVLMTDPQKGMHHGHPDPASRFDAAYVRSALTGAGGGAAVLVSLIGGLVAALLLGQNDLPGQSVGAGFAGGLLGGVAGAMTVTGLRGKDGPHDPVALAPIVVGVMLCAIVAPLIGLIRPGAGGLLDAVTGGGLPGYLIVSPSGWVMGALLGAPIGHSWVEQSAAHAAGGKPAAGAR